MDIKLKNLEMLTQQCWSRAQGNLIQAVAQRHHAPQERPGFLHASDRPQLESLIPGNCQEHEDKS
jgi:hypothetical protein